MPGKDFRFGISGSVQGVDLNQLLVRHTPSTYFMRVSTDLPELGLLAGDIVLVDRALQPLAQDLVVVTEAEQPGLKITRFKQLGKELELWGVVEHLIRRLRP